MEKLDSSDLLTEQQTLLKQEKEGEDARSKLMAELKQTQDSRKEIESKIQKL